MAVPSHRRSLRKRRTLAVSAAAVAAGVGAGVFEERERHRGRPLPPDAPRQGRNLPAEPATTTGAGVLK
ncbi:hypothetical protein ABT187_31240 [Streptomyces sp. NPDC001817]|uniref:hypothetical protein n=1 Tax=Streptomyces sp. NPDC001817 TaxID=3154398 RepID=UPI00332F9476